MEVINDKYGRFAEVFNQIPEIYREKYGIKLITANESSKYSVLYAEIREAKISIIPRGKHITINEQENQLTIYIDEIATIRMHKDFTLIYTLL